MSQAPVQNKFRVGSLELTVVSDGTVLGDAGAIFGVVPRSLWEPLVGPPGSHHRFPQGLNCVIFRSLGKLILIETGMGNKISGKLREHLFPGDYGFLLEDMAKVGIKPEEVDIVINTHLHADHCGWNTAVRNGKVVPTFPRARYWVQKGEWEAARNPNDRTRGTYLPENLGAVEESGQLHLVDGETDVTPEVKIFCTPGHTADHASVAITSGGETALYLGDINQHPIQLERYPWISAFDVLPLLAIETKKKLVERAIREQTLLICVHHPFPGVGRMTQVNGRRSWQPL